MATAATEVLRSNLPRAEKNAILRFIGRAGSGIKSYGSRAMSFGRPFAAAAHKSAPVATAIGMGAGALLGALHVKLPQGLDIRGKAPADLIAAIGLTAVKMGAVSLGHGAVAHHAGTLAIASGSVFSFRKSVDLLSELERRKGRSPGGTVGMKRLAGAPSMASHHGDRDPLAAFAETL